MEFDLKIDKEIVNKIFNEKVNSFLFNINNKIYFGETVFYLIQMNILESVTSKLPYAIIKFQINKLDIVLIDNDNKFNKCYKCNKCYNELFCEWINKYVSAEMPDISNIILYNKVNNYMLNNCFICCKTSIIGISSDHTKHHKIILNTYIDKDNELIFRKRNMEDLKVIPYNPQILIDWDGFIKFEYSNSSELIF